MQHFSSMTAEEFFTLNRDSLPENVIKMFDEMSSKVSFLENEVRLLRKDQELENERMCFASDLIEEINNEVKDSKTKQAKTIRGFIENSYHEL